MAYWVFHRIACSFGIHHKPPERRPPGSVVAECPLCGKVVYYYSLSASLGSYPTLPAPDFPRVIRALPPSPK